MTTATNTADAKNNDLAATGLAKLFALYAINDCDRFPGNILPDGMERAKTLYWADFSVADAYGLKAIKETFANAKHETLGYKELTELVICLNHKIWQYYEISEAYKGNGNVEAGMAAEEKARLYNDLWERTSAYAQNTLKGDEARFYYIVTD